MANGVGEVYDMRENLREIERLAPRYGVTSISHRVDDDERIIATRYWRRGVDVTAEVLEGEA